MQNERVNADFSQRIVLATDALPWIPSPQAGVERRLLDRIGGEVARATSIVRYAPNSNFPAHGHELGEEFLVLDGVFSDEFGDYPTGCYVRNPPGSRHAPFTRPGCIILVKLRQMDATQSRRVAVETAAEGWRLVADGRPSRLDLYQDASGEAVALTKLAAGGRLPAGHVAGLEEIFVLDGSLRDPLGVYGKGTWIRNPAGPRAEMDTDGGAVFWMKSVCRIP